MAIMNDDLANKLGIKKGFSQRYEDTVLLTGENGLVTWYDGKMDAFRVGIITEVVDDEIYIKPFDSEHEIAWPRNKEE